VRTLVLFRKIHPCASFKYEDWEEFLVWVKFYKVDFKVFKKTLMTKLRRIRKRFPKLYEQISATKTYYDLIDVFKQNNLKITLLIETLLILVEDEYFYIDNRCSEKVIVFSVK